MASLQVRAGAHSAQGLRPNNQDRYIADTTRDVFLVADGMGGQESGEKASTLAAEVLPRAIQTHLQSHGDPAQAVIHALQEANQAILAASKHQRHGRRMGTTVVLAVRWNDQLHVAGLGDSRAYLVRGEYIEQLTHDHSMAEALRRSGTLTSEQAKQSPSRHMLYRYLGCPDLSEAAEVRFCPLQPGDRLVLASDGLTNHIFPDDLRVGARTYPDPQDWANELVLLALERGSNDNVTCVVVAFS